ncbi:hypothetical protein [Flavobacterium sp. AJR]|uniref:hypothetical protein n=1 Tax=Flavobacterium sp. AJR TaxID=1979369 RepID=UPI000A3D6488|nr:hypothetical protein [Flavobacterium sp. AJR]OUL63978.1 hypothetical protein B8T70_02425 [Flavobacterium sp. AJR]
MRIIKKLGNAFEFFKSTIAINLAVSILPLLFGGLLLFNYSVVSFGFAISLAVKEINSKNEYLFYFNNGLSKGVLWFYSWCFILIFLISGIFVFNLINRLF